MTSKQRVSWFIVLYEWQACQGMSTDPTWYLSAQIFRERTGATETVSLLRLGEQCRSGKLTYRNIRGPFPWLESSPVETTVRKAVMGDVYPCLEYYDEEHEHRWIDAVDPEQQVCLTCDSTRMTPEILQAEPLYTR